MSEIPTMQDPCKICKGLGSTQGVISEPGMLQRCLRCEGTGVEPPDIKSRELIITVTAFWSPKVQGWVVGLDAKSERPNVTAETIIDVLHNVVNMLSGNRFITPSPSKPPFQ